MTDVAAIVRTAETYVGTPFVHHGRNPGGGLDCIGVILCAAWEHGVDLPDEPYQRQPNPEWMIAGLRARFDGAQGGLGFGRVLLFECSALSDPMHIGFQISEQEMVHGFDLAIGRGGPKRRGRIVRGLLGRYWRDRLHSAWSFR